MTRVKICGVTTASDLRAVADAGADAVGVVADVPVDTPREVAADRAAELVADAPPFLTTVLVCMPESPAHAVDLASVVGPDVLQIHGDVDADDLRFVRAESGAKVAPVVDAADPDRARAYDGVADAVVVDSTSEDGAGGTGETHDWTATRDLAADLSTPVILAGGLTPTNVGEAVETVAPYAVDVASGVESTGGHKDHEAVAAFVRNARRREVTA